ncbi:MAG: glycosyltransferase [Archaeoglobaceae archaeon]
MYKGKKIGVAIPAYNEEKNIGRVLSEIPEFVDRIYVVDDGSTDKTPEIVEEISKKDHRVFLIRHEKNMGKGAATVTGWKRGIEDEMDVLVAMDGDAQMDPAYLPSLLDPIVENKADFSKGTRFWGDAWKSTPKIRIFGSFLLNVLNKIASGYWHVNDPQNGYVAISAEALRKLELDKLYKGYAFENDVLIKANVAGIRVVNVPVLPRYHENATSKLRISRFLFETSWFLLKRFLWRIWKKYIVRGNPIGFAYLLGFVLILLGVIFVIFANYFLALVLGVIFFLIACFFEWR